VVKRLWSGMVSGHVDRSLLTRTMAEFIAGNHGSHSKFAHYGTVQTWNYRGRTARRAGPSYLYRLLCVNGRSVDLIVRITAQHQIDGLTYWLR
jgi:hypothetical protein